jgi:ferrous iron transport protein A
MKTAGQDLKFSELRPGMRARVENYASTGPDTHRFMDLGLVPGAEFEVLREAPFGGPIEICLFGSSLCLRRCEGDCLLVKAINSN